MIEYVELYCKVCKLYFKVDEDVQGVITCPYCSEYIEG